MLTGHQCIGFTREPGEGIPFHAVDPAAGLSLEPAYRAAGPEQVDAAVAVAAAAFETTRRASGAEKGSLLRAIAANLESRADDLAARAGRETALPEARIRVEVARAAGQLRMFAELVEEGSWVDARIDRPDPKRLPFPKPDVRSMERAIGPVVVFGASNFPVAFSVAGGDTASALAAGCPVIVKAHPAHPGASEIAGETVLDAVRACRFPDGTFSLLFDGGHDVGRALVTHPHVRAVGFTGSRAGGRALMDLAAARRDPIPVFAEMGSVNPVFVLPAALRARGAAIADGLHASVTLGVGQFCTNPGLAVIPAGADGDAFRDRLLARMEATPAGTMLTRGICDGYAGGVARLAARVGVRRLGAASTDAAGAGFTAGAALFETHVRAFVSDIALMDEVFGPSTLLVRAAGETEMLAAARALEGQLTATVHADADDMATAGALIAMVETRVGRVVMNGFPTGVEVGPAMVHGGPWPATSDGRATSVGTRAIVRFTRPVAYQDLPDALLPEELREANPLAIRRTVTAAPR